MTIRTAIIGLGIMGRRMAEHMSLHEAYELSGLWDPNAEACKAAALLPRAYICSTAEEAMASADLVYLACPPRPRKAYALEAAKAGKAVFLEKPLGVDIAESEALVAHLAASGVPAAVNFTQAAGAALSHISRAAKDGAMSAVLGVDIVVTYSKWPRQWQAAADWLRYGEEGGMTREVISHFLFFSERILGPLSVISAFPTYPSDPTLCETHMLARLEAEDGRPVAIMASVGGAQPDRQELTIKGAAATHRVSEFFIHSCSDGGPFVPVGETPDDPRAVILRSQLDDLLLCLKGEPHSLATPAEALRVQKLVEAMLVRKS